MSRTALRIILVEVVATCLLLTGVTVARSVSHLDDDRRQPAVVETELAGDTAPIGDQEAGR